MRLSDLQTKDVVNLKDGKKVGKIIDAEIDSEGRIVYLVIEQGRSLRNLMSSINDTTITFSQIDKIGSDVILVNI